MTFGDDPAQGIRKGWFFRTQICAFNLKFRKLYFFNSPNQVIAIGPNKSKIIFYMANPEYIRQSGSLRKYLLTHWSSNLDLQNIESVDVNGMRATRGLGQLKLALVPAIFAC